MDCDGAGVRAARGAGRELVFGLAPALQTSRVQLVDGLRQGGKGTSIGARGAWARNAFVVAEIALAVVLVAGAGLLARSLAALAAVDMGFTPDRLLGAEHRRFRCARSTRRRARRRSIATCSTDVRALPGVDAVGGVTSLPTAHALERRLH